MKLKVSGFVVYVNLRQTLTKADVKFLPIGGAVSNGFYQLVLEFAGRVVVLISWPEIISVIINVDNYLHSVTATTTL